MTMTNNVKIVSAIATSAVIGTCLLFGCGITVTPEKPEVVKEGFSGQKKPVVETKNEFTGSHHATVLEPVVVTPQKPEVVKEGFSGKKDIAIETKEGFTGSSKAIIDPEPQEVVKEGYSGTSSKVVATHGSFTGGNDKKIVVTPEPPKTYSGYSKPYNAGPTGLATPNTVPGKDKVPEKGKAPYLVPKTKLELMISDLEALVAKYK